MRHAAGQAARHVHLVLRAVLVVLVLAAVLLGGLSWRLSRGPLALPWLIPYVEQAMPAPYRLRVEHLALAWDGLGDRLDRPLELHLQGVAVTDRTGAPILRAPSVEVSLAIRPLLYGALRPRAIDIDGLRLAAWRRPDGAVALDLADGPPAQDAGPQTPAPADGKGSGLLHAVLAELARPPDSGILAAPHAAFLSALRRVRLTDAAIAITDRKLATTWRLDHIRLDLHRRAQGGMDAGAALDLLLGAHRLAVSASASLPAGGDEIGVRVALPPLVPAELAEAAPGLKPLAAVAAPLTLTLVGAIDSALAHPRLGITAELGPGLVHLGQGALPIAGAKLTAEGTPDEFDLRILHLDLAAPDRPASRLTGWLHARRDAGQLDAVASLSLDQVDFADLPALWPVGLGGPGTRPWLTTNITAGRLSGLHLDLALSAAADLSGAHITYIDAGAAGHDLTVHWLSPVPPLVQGEAVVSITDPDAIRIRVLSAIQSFEPGKPAPGPPLALTGGEVVLSGLTGHDQFADITGQFRGRLVSLLAVLGHPRLHLLDRRPIPLHHPAGEVTGQINVARLPLKKGLDMADVRITAGGHLTGVHLGGIAAGHDLDRGVLDLAAGNDGLTVAGTAELAGIPAKLKVAMDFRAGPPSQAIQMIAVQAAPTAEQLARLGLGLPDMLTGAVALDAQMTTRRDGAETLAVKADLAPAGLTLRQLNWTKPPTRPASATATVRMRGGRISAIEGLQATGPGLDLSASLAFAAGRPRLLELRRLALGAPGQQPQTDIAGTLAWPAQPGAPWIAKLHGASLDASAEFTGKPQAEGKPRTEPKPNAETGPPWQVEARLGRLLTGDGAALSDLRLDAASDGRIITRAALSGATLPAAGVPGGRFEVSIRPAPGGRSLAASVTDAGGLARALGVAPDLYGGALALNGRYDDTAAAHPLTGAVTITDFRLKDAPFAAKLLQALSVYGIVAALASPDLGITEFAARFHLADDVLTLAQARAFNATLGITGKGRLDLARHVADVDGTIVPAYLLNSLLGRIPLIGKLVSPEKGGGLIAMNYSLRGPFGDPSVSVNPLSAVTPGFLRGIFDIFDGASPPAGTPQERYRPAG